MVGNKIIAICQLGGEFETDKDGSFSYKGGDAHAIDVDDQMKFNDFKTEVAEMFNCHFNAISLKYFLPGNKKTLITISNDKDLQRMIKFNGDCVTTDVFVILEEIVEPNVSNMPASRSSRTTQSESVPPVGFVEHMVNSNIIPLSAPIDVEVDSNSIDVNIDDSQINLPAEISPILPIVGSNDEKHVKATSVLAANPTPSTSCSKLGPSTSMTKPFGSVPSLGSPEANSIRSSSGTTSSVSGACGQGPRTPVFGSTFNFAPALPAFGQQPISPPSSFVFGSSTLSGANHFQLGSQQNLATPRLSNLDFNAGGSFSLGVCGYDKSQRRMVKVHKQRKK